MKKDFPDVINKAFVFTGKAGSFEIELDFKPKNKANLENFRDEIVRFYSIMLGVRGGPVKKYLN